MSIISEPIIRCIPDNEKSLDELEDELKVCDGREVEYLKDYPTVYIHNWPQKGIYEVYVGEANNFIRRTKEHYSKKKDPNGWQYSLNNPKASMYVIGHEIFNKSLTLDVENRLMHYLMSVDKVKHVHNGRSNPQGKYFPSDKFDSVFDAIWNKLHGMNSELFPDAHVIKDSAIYKASPFHKLTPKQLEARDSIIETIDRALERTDIGGEKQIVFIDGEAGTGKTVLNTSTFFELFCHKASDENFKFSVVINHAEQVKVYSDIAEKLGITEKYGECITKASRFLNLHKEEDSVDVVFIDEAHLLFTEGNQGYRGKNQLEDIIKKARVTVVVFDENQILRMDQYLESELLEKYREIAIRQNNHIILTEQLRIVADERTLEWVDSFTKERTLKKIPHNDSHNYEIKVFDTPIELQLEIEKKASNDNTRLSRLIANYDWEYKEGKRPSKISNPSERVGALFKYWAMFKSQYKDTWGVYIESEKWFKPWNYETKKYLSSAEKKKIKDQSWAEQEHTINEVGSTYTIQGFDLNYAGVILGKSVKYRNGKILFDPTETCNDKVNRRRTMLDGSKKCFAEDLLKHEIRVLMTRGVNGLYIYACDDELRKALKEANI